MGVCHILSKLLQFSLPQILCSVERGRCLPKTAHAQNEYSCDSDTSDKLILASMHRQFTQSSAKFLILLKKAQVSWMCFIISNDLYTAHHNLFGICHQLKICHLYGTFNISTQCICMGTGSLLSMVFVERRRPLPNFQCMDHNILCQYICQRYLWYFHVE